MRRAVAAVLGTVAGTTLLVAAKLGTPTGDTTATGDTTGTGGVTVSGGNGPGPAAGGASNGPGTPAPSLRPGQTPPPTTPGGPPPTTPGGHPTTTAPQATPPSTTSGYKDATYNASSNQGDSYGTVNLTVTISGGKISAITATYSNYTHSESLTISNKAFPTLKQEALTAQSASIATVSHATYTSNAFKSALSKILNAAK